MPTHPAITISLPIPHKSQNPNSRIHWRPKAAQTKIHRHRAKLLTLEALHGQAPPAVTSYSLHFHFPTRRGRDDDNAGGSFKAYRDGIADALRIDDKNLKMTTSPQMLHDKTNPRLDVRLYL